MAHLKTQKEVIELGKLFVKELGLEQTRDTFSRWMANYLAEKINLSDSLKDSEKEKVEKECFEIILQLWRHRWTLPHNKRPLEEFEPILNFLQKLNPDKENPFYFPEIPQWVQESKKKKAAKDPVQTWLEIARNIDSTSRIWMFEVLNFAAASAQSPKTAQWLKKSAGFPRDHDFETIRIVLKHQDEDDEKQNEELDKHKVENIRKKIDTLERFAKFNAFMIDKFRAEIDSIETKE